MSRSSLPLTRMFPCCRSPWANLAASISFTSLRNFSRSAARSPSSSVLGGRAARQPDQGHVVVARSFFARLRHQQLEVLGRLDAGADPLPSRLALLGAPQEPRGQRIGGEEEDVVPAQDAFA